jgi:hypothetical protein
LRGAPDGQTAIEAERITDQTAALQRHASVAVHAKTLVHHDIRSLYSSISVANGMGEADSHVVRPARKEAGRLRGHGSLCLDDGWQGLILDSDEFRSVLSLSPAVGDDDGHRLSRVAYPLTRQW